MLAFSWDSANIDHIARHGITPEEAEQVIENDPFDMRFQVRNGEERMKHLGETNAGRVLVVVTTDRGDLVRVVTAHPADRATRRLYQQLKEAHNAKDFGNADLQE